MSEFSDLFNQAEAELVDLLEELVPSLDVSPGTVARELLVRPAAILRASEFAEVDTVRDQMSLSLVLQEDSPDSTVVDNLLANFNVVRREGVRTTGKINIYTKQTQNVYVPQSTRFSCGDATLMPVKTYVGVNGTVTSSDTESVSYVQMRQYDQETRVFTITATTTEAIESVLSQGQTCTMTPSSTQVSSVEIGSTFSGGTVRESNAELLLRAATATNARILCGRDQIESFLEANTTYNILDVKAFGMGSDLMLRDKDAGDLVSRGGSVDIYVKTSPVPTVTSTELEVTKRSDGKWAAQLSSTLFPGAYGVDQVRWQSLNLDTATTLELGYSREAGDPVMSEAAHARYSSFQTMTVVVDSTDLQGSVGDALTLDLNVLHMPGIGAIQDLVDDPSVKNYAFDTMVKGAIPVLVGVHVTMEYVQGITPPEEADVQQAVADAINAKSIGAEYLSTAEVVVTANEAFPDGEVKMPVNLFGRIFMPNGTQSYATDQNYLMVQASAGISYRNCCFFCYPDNVDVSLVEVSG